MGPIAATVSSAERTSTDKTVATLDVVIDVEADFVSLAEEHRAF